MIVSFAGNHQILGFLTSIFIIVCVYVCTWFVNTYAHTYFLHEQNLAQNQLTFILVR